MSEDNLIGANIKKFRKMQGLTQEKLAEAAGLETKHICRIETGRHVPNTKTLNKILAALNVSYADIGLDFGANRPARNNPFYEKILNLINSSDEKELEYFCGLLFQAKKGLEIFKL